jgi:colanic acid biosynthesis protein WcaH
MDVHDERIPDETFGVFLDAMPQVSVEIVLEHEGSVLLVRRTNDPAKGEWFWPGTRLYKGETFEHAVGRLAQEELGIEVEIRARIGVYNHFWETANLPSVESTHTVNVVYHVRPADAATGLDGLELDDQHDEYRLIDRIEPSLHEYVKRYLDESSLLD